MITARATTWNSFTVYLIPAKKMKLECSELQDVMNTIDFVQTRLYIEF